MSNQARPPGERHGTAPHPPLTPLPASWSRTLLRAYSARSIRASTAASATTLPRQAAICLLLLGYLLVGVFGRFPWKADEPYSLGVILEILEENQWLVPHVADQPFLEKPPLVYWLGALSVKLFSFLPPHEGSRMALLLLVAATVLALAGSAWLLWPEATRWRRSRGTSDPEPSANAGEFRSRREYALLAVLLFAGTLGFTEQIHKLTADIGQLAGCTIALAGLIGLGAASSSLHADAPRRSILSGIAIGTGVGIGFMSKGLLVPGVITLTWLLCLSLPSYRSLSARRGARIAVAASLPWLLIWPSLLFQNSPNQFDEWLWDNNVGRFLGHVALGGTGVSSIDKIAALALASFPALPLACATVVRSLRCRDRGGRSISSRQGEVSGHVCVALFALVSLTIIFVSSSFRDNYLLPVLPSLVLLALPALILPPGRLQRIWKLGANSIFAVMAIAVVLIWAQLVVDGSLWPQALRTMIVRVLPLPYALPLQLSSVLIAAGALGLWSFVNSTGQLRGFVTPWCAGIAMLWVVVFSLLLPWIDSARSYRGVFTGLSPYLVDSDCLATSNLGESELAMLEYVTSIEATRIYLGHSGSGDPARPNAAAAVCNQILVLSRGASRTSPSGRGWSSVWTGSRPGDSREHFELYRRHGSREAASR